MALVGSTLQFQELIAAEGGGLSLAEPIPSLPHNIPIQPQPSARLAERLDRVPASALQVTCLAGDRDKFIT